jgi:MFS transporter, FSR family, fosmidomycin resistance protein
MSIASPIPRHGSRVNLLIGTGHFCSHFYQLCLPPLFLVWQRDFAVSFAEVGVATVVMSVACALLQTPYGFLVERYGARWFLIGGTVLMSGSIALMAWATAFWQIIILALASGVGNAVFHPADYSILAGSIAKNRMGRAFALHSFTGYVGFAAGPVVIAGLLGVVGWRGALFIVGVAGLPVATALLWQSRILQDETRKETKRHRLSIRDLLFEPTMVLFFLFYLLVSMAGSGVQAWLITILHQTQGIDLHMASWALTAFFVGVSGGTLVGGWAADRSKRHLALAIVVLMAATAILLLIVDFLPMSAALVIGLMLIAGLTFGGSRTPRDIMLKDAAPPGEIGKVFGYVSAGLPLGGALTPVPFGFVIDQGQPRLVLVLSAVLLFASLLCMGTAKSSARHAAWASAAE